LAAVFQLPHYSIAAHIKKKGQLAKTTRFAGGLDPAILFMPF